MTARTETSLFVCQLCPPVRPFQTQEKGTFIAHAMQVHRLTELEVRKAPGEKTTHLDGTGFATSIYQFKLRDGTPLLSLSKTLRWGKRG